MKAQKKIIIITAAAVCLLSVLLFTVIFVLRFIEPDNDEPNKTTDTWSSEFTGIDEKLAFLTEYLIMPSEVLDAEYHIVYHDNSTGLIPGPSDWDVRVALKIKAEELPLWTDGFDGVSPNEIDLAWWNELPSDDISWDSAGAEYYKRESSFSYLVVFPDTGVILKAVSTSSYSMANAKNADLEISLDLSYPIMAKAYDNPIYSPCAVMVMASSGTYDEMLESLLDGVMYAPPILGDFDHDGVYECIYTATKWDAPASQWHDILFTKEEFLQGIENLEKGLVTNAGVYDIAVTEKQANIYPDLPDFIFQERKRTETGYVSAMDRLVVFEVGTAGLMPIASFDLLQYTLWGEPTVSGESLNIEFIDMNFDGYKDIMLFDKPAGNWNIHYIYFIWDAEANTFVHTAQFSKLGLPTFDEEKQLVYSMQRDSAADHWFYTHKYIDGVLTVIEIESDNSVHFKDDVTGEQIAALIPLAAEYPSAYFQHYKMIKRNMDTLEMETIEDKYRLYVPNHPELYIEYDADSEIGRTLYDLIDWRRTG